MHFVEFCLRPDIDQHRLGASFDVGNQLIYSDELGLDIGGQSLLGELGIFGWIGMGAGRE